MSEDGEKLAFGARIRHYAEILNPIFDPGAYCRDPHRLLEFVCALVRCSGIEDSGWDPFYESEAILNDLQTLAGLQLPIDKFPEANRTRLRLGLLSYCHVIEMDLPYSLLANLLRLRLGEKYDMNPFRDLIRFMGKERIPMIPAPSKKIQRLKELSRSANLGTIGEIFDTTYDAAVRNAVYHSDYTLTDKELRLLAGARFSRKHGVRTPVVELDELNQLVVETFAFYRALFSLYERTRSSFDSFKDALLPFDHRDKGILQLVFDDESRLVGFRIYWPNESVSEFTRRKNGCDGVNLFFENGGSINFMVGLYAAKPGTFSPLVEASAEPRYSEIPGTKLRPHWPNDLKVYKVNRAA